MLRPFSAALEVSSLFFPLPRLPLLSLSTLPIFLPNSASMLATF